MDSIDGFEPLGQAVYSSEGDSAGQLEVAAGSPGMHLAGSDFNRQVLEPILAVAEQGVSASAQARAEAQAANDELAALVDPDNEDSALWQIQIQINDLDRQAIAALEAATAANTLAIRALSQHTMRMLHIPSSGTVSDENWSSTRSGRRITLTRVGDWSGAFVVVYTVDVDVYSSYESSGDHSSHQHRLDDVREPRQWHQPVPTPEGYTAYQITHDGPATLFYFQNPGVPTTENFSDDSTRTLGSGAWTPLHEFTMPKKAQVTTSGSFTFSARTYGGTYGVRLTVDGVSAHNSATIASAPIIGHGPRSAATQMNLRQLEAGQTIRLEAYASHSNATNRQVRNSKLQIMWIDEGV